MSSLDDYTSIVADDESTTFREKFSNWARKCFSVKKLKRHVPIINWLPQYNASKLQSDAVAGITVGLTVIPQGMAYASVAGLPLQYGLYSAFMACFVYCIFGSTNEVTIGPTAIMGLLTAEQSKKGGPTYAVLLCFLSGVTEFLFGFFNLGFLIDFIPVPVISGFSSSAAIIIATTQIKGLLGLTFEADQFIPVIYNVVTKITQTNYWDLILGIICMIMLLFLRKISRIHWADEERLLKWYEKLWRKFLWFIGTGRNALIVVCMGLLAFGLELFNKNIFTLTGEVKPGLPPFQFPQFSLQRGNETINFLQILAELESSLALIPLLAILEHIAIAKVFAQGKTLDATQELLALGLSNILGSFVSSFPSTGSFSRTALNASSGVKSPLGGLFTGALVLLALGVLTESFKFIPKATLSSVIICTVVFMVEYEMFPHLWKTKKSDFFLLVATFFSCIFAGAEYGILIGTGIALFILLYNTARPSILVRRSRNTELDYILVKPDRALYYPAMEYMKYRINKLSRMATNLPVVFDGAHLCGPDYTIAQGIKQLTQEFKHRNQKLVFTNLRQEVIDIIEHLEPEDFQHCRTREEIEAVLTEKYPGALQPDVPEEPINSVPKASNDAGHNYSTFRAQFPSGSSHTGINQTLLK
uniref:SLC26A/SulP transporter domain-containing protein n=1 Tax=Strigamia maritima TaxID=126957 RepID=T1IX46_STRMM